MFKESSHDGLLLGTGGRVNGSLRASILFKKVFLFFFEESMGFVCSLFRRVTTFKTIFFVVFPVTVDTVLCPIRHYSLITIDTVGEKVAEEVV